MEIFEKAFNWLAQLSSKLPVIDFQMYFIVVVAILLGVGVIVALTYLGSRAFKLIAASKKIQKYLSQVDVIDDDNVSDFTARCFSAKAPQPLRDAWVQYLGVRFGYPSDVVSDGNVYDKVVKKNKDIRSLVYLGVSLIVLAIFAFWGYGTLQTVEMSVVHFVGLLIIGVVFLLLVIINNGQNKKCLEVFDAMQEDLDVKVNLQIESNYATDSSPLQDLSAMLDEIIARNTAKVVELEEAVIEQTPIEALIEESEDAQDDVLLQEAEEVNAVEDSQVGDVQIEEISQSEGEQSFDEPIVNEETLEAQETQSEDVQESIADESIEIEESDSVVDREDLVAEETEEEQNAEIVDEQAVEETREDEQVEVEAADENNEQETVEEEFVEDESVENETEDVADEAQSDDVAEQAFVEEQDVEELSDDSSEEQIVSADAEEENLEYSEEAENTEDSEEVAETDDESAEETTAEIESDVDVENVQEEDVVEDVDADAENEELDEEETIEEESEDDNDEGEETDESDSEEEPQVVYVVDGEDEEEANVKPSRFHKLPNLIDYMLSKNMTKAMKIQIATVLIATYKKVSENKEDRRIVVQCLTKVMQSLQQG